MKRASYREAILWIAENDSAGVDEALDVYEVSGLITVVLISDIFDVGAAKIAKDVIRERKKRNQEGKCKTLRS